MLRCRANAANAFRSFWVRLVASQGIRDPTLRSNACNAPEENRTHVAHCRRAHSDAGRDFGKSVFRSTENWSIDQCCLMRAGGGLREDRPLAPAVSSAPVELLVTDSCQHYGIDVDIDTSCHRNLPRAYSGVVRIDPLRFLVGCRKKGV